MLTLLFFLRLLSALILLLFLVVIGWVMLRDMRLTARLVADREEPRGTLRVVLAGAVPLEVGQEFKLMPVTGIGRAHDNTIVLDDEYVSSRHVLLTLRGQQWWLEDLGSSNGTLLNEQPVSQPVVVSQGDNITIGKTVLRLDF